MSEKISELIDGRGSPDQRHHLFDHILADHGAGEAWRHYHLIGCVLRGEVAQTGADLSARIGRRLEQEPRVLAPVPGARRRFSMAWKSAGVVALAASLALIAVISLNPARDGGGTPVAQLAPAQPARPGQEFREMLAQHGEFASSPGLNGLIVYAKLVGSQPLDR
ncbi:MAG: sigma-E factor negative regulatory protein [Gammaproteobacteria bacterium]|nr:sigma-E factor negative regulatory protein [Gammaproteobacteria bacterium]MDD9874159.1 sigma-E factor negative regulatory protein [Gammaproteobacteria bacterium]